MDMTQEERNQLYLESYRASLKEAADALAARDEAQKRLDLANSASMAWKTIIDQAGLTAPNGSAQPSTSAGQSRKIASEPNSAIDATPNKAEFVRSAIISAGTYGITPAEIKTASTNAGIDVYAGYPYTVIYKLKEQKKVTENSKGRLVWNKP
jgi:hypothetical protein